MGEKTFKITFEFGSSPFICVILKMNLLVINKT